MKNANWFNAMIEFRNTVKAIQSVWSVPRAVAQDMQIMIATRKSQIECDMVARASFDLRQQVGF